MKRTFYLQDDQSNKFWNIECRGDTIITENGRIGAKPRLTQKTFESTDAALRALARDIHEKRKKGYLEGDASSLPPHSKRLPPRLVRINHDDYKARYVGKLKDGSQFFLTFPFEPRLEGRKGGNYIALYRFDEYGALLEAEIFDEKQEGLTTESAVDAFTERLLERLGPHTFQDISVTPFSVSAFGLEFGLIFDPGDDDTDDAGEDDDDDPSIWVTVEPGNYMAFFPPWDGEYDT